jgi:selenide,water dikinase
MDNNNKFDLMTTVEYGGCSAKIPPKVLSKILEHIPKPDDANILVDIETHDDAGVYKLNDETALIYTTDFFPPVCSDPHEFGEIAAANALSDVYAMGGTPLMALNLMMFSSEKIPLEAFADIIKGGQTKTTEAGAVILGGHTIEDYPPKYGLAVVGTVHPDKLITNAGAKPGDKLILTKPIGTGVITTAKRLDMVDNSIYQQALDQMKLLNKKAAELMQKYNANACTDITGFGLLGHTIEMAEASNVTVTIDSETIPVFPDAEELLDDGCIPGAIFRNREYIEEKVTVTESVRYNRLLLANDAQTSGGLLISVPAESADSLLSDIMQTGLHPNAAIIGEVKEKDSKYVVLI